MLTIWSTAPLNKVLSNLSPVLKSVSGLSVQVVNPTTYALSAGAGTIDSVPEGTSLILALGGVAYKKLQEAGSVAKNRTITHYRTQPLQYGQTPVLLSYSADICDIDHRYYVDLLTDVTLGVRYCLTGQWKPLYGTYRYVPDFADLCVKIEQQYAATQQPVALCKDLETLGLDPYAVPLLSPPYPGAYIVTMQASCEAGTADIVRFTSPSHEKERLQDPDLRGQLDFLLNSPKVKLRGANFKFDLHWLWVRAQMTCSTFVFDTTLVGSLLDENRSNALDVHVKIYVPPLAGYSDEFDRKYDKGRMDLIPPEDLKPYAGGDVDGGLQVGDVMKENLLRDSKLAGFYVNILHPAARAFEWIEQGGICIDKHAFKELKADLEAAHIDLVTRASKIIGGRIVAKHLDTSKPGGLNITKAALVCDYMFSPMGLHLKPKMFTPKPDKDGIKRPSTAIEHLEMFEDVPEAQAFVSIVKEDGKVQKTLGTYVDGFLEHLRSDGRFHPTYFLFVGNQDEGEGGARTGRLSAKAPAFQTLPKHTIWAPKIRRCYTAPPGYVVVERDYSQGELRVVACIAHEKNMIQAYKEGKDLHADTGATFANLRGVLPGITYEAFVALATSPDPKQVAIYEEYRQTAKPANFGLLYAMGWESFQTYARVNYGVVITDTEAQLFRTGFFDKFSGLIAYHKEYKGIAHKEKQVRSPLGRIRHLPLIDSPNQEYVAQAERQAINSPVQGCLSDMVLWTLAIEHKMGLSKQAPCFGVCHDSISNYVPEDQVDVLVPQMLEVMENLPFEKVQWTPQLKFLADAKYGPNMGDLHKFKKPV